MNAVKITVLRTPCETEHGDRDSRDRTPESAATANSTTVAASCTTQAPTSSRPRPSRLTNCPVKNAPAIPAAPPRRTLSSPTRPGVRPRGAAR